jgi:hypothetical protein
LKPVFAERDKKQTMIDLRGISTTGLKTNYVPPESFLGYELGTVLLKKVKSSLISYSTYTALGNFSFFTELDPDLA